jgi:Crp-like helix-turn-helix domain
MPSTTAAQALYASETIPFDDVPVRNQLLAALDVSVLGAMKPHFRTSYVEPPAVLFGTAGSIGDVHFPENAIVSLVGSTAGVGGAVEVEAVGNEGMAGLSVFLTGHESTVQGFVLGAGVVRRMDARIFRELAAAPGPLHQVMLSYTHAVILRAGQTLACRAAHVLQQRCAGWLLETRERVGEDEFPLAEAFLSLMLGARRSGVLHALRSLEDRRLIRCERGTVEIVDAHGLEQESCGCHAVVRATYTRLLPSLA